MRQAIHQVATATEIGIRLIIVGSTVADIIEGQCCGCSQSAREREWSSGRIHSPWHFVILPAADIGCCESGGLPRLEREIRRDRPAIHEEIDAHGIQRSGALGRCTGGSGGGGGVLGRALVAGLHGEGVAGGGDQAGRGINRAVLPWAACSQRHAVEAVFHAARVAGGGGRHGDRGGPGRCRWRSEGHRIRRRLGGVGSCGGEVPGGVVVDPAKLLSAVSSMRSRRSGRRNSCRSGGPPSG